jgi:hypothetical protein
MARLRRLKIEILESRHPGLRQKVNAMFEAFATVRAVGAMIEAEYGERIGRTAIGIYKRRFWRKERDRIQEMNAARIACQELASEERN